LIFFFCVLTFPWFILFSISSLVILLNLLLIQIWSSFFWLLFSYLFFKILCLNILFYFLFNLSPHSFNYYIFIILFFNLVPNDFLSFSFYNPYCLDFKLFCDWKFYFVIFSCLSFCMVNLVLWSDSNLSFFYPFINFFLKLSFKILVIRPRTWLFFALSFLLGYSNLILRVTS